MMYIFSPTYLFCLLGIPMKEFVGLRPKMYSFIFNERNGSSDIEEIEKKTAKGITKTAKERQLTHEKFRQCLFKNEITVHDMKMIRSVSHQLYLNNVRKRGLINYDDKRYWEGIKSLAFGHYKINTST